MLLTFIYNYAYRCIYGLRIRARTAIFMRCREFQATVLSRFFSDRRTGGLFFGLALFFSLFASLKLGSWGQNFWLLLLFIGLAGPITFLLKAMRRGRRDNFCFLLLLSGLQAR